MEMILEESSDKEDTTQGATKFPVNMCKKYGNKNKDEYNENNDTDALFNSKVTPSPAKHLKPSKEII